MHNGNNHLIVHELIFLVSVSSPCSLISPLFHLVGRLLMGQSVPTNISVFFCYQLFLSFLVPDIDFL